MSKIEKVDAQALLASVQQMRTTLRGGITTHLTVALTVNVALWSYFTKSYFDQLASSSGYAERYLLVVSALSSILFGLWRLSARYTDSFIARLYPDFLLYEGILGAPETRSTSGYLCEAVPNVKKVLTSALSSENKLEVVSDLVQKRKIGDRGHQIIDLCVLVILIAMTLLSLLLIVRSTYSCSTDSWFLCLIGNGMGFFALICVMTHFQRNPSLKMVENSMDSFRK